VTAILALAGALILAGVATFGYFGGYWWQYWEQIRDTTNAPERKHWMDAAIARHRMDRSNYEMADAVIAELGLTKEDEYNPYNPFPPPYRVRYVTEWKADDE
jgi:hypothetical protein